MNKEYQYNLILLGKKENPPRLEKMKITQEEYLFIKNHLSTLQQNNQKITTLVLRENNKVKGERFFMGNVDSTKLLINNLLINLHAKNK